MYVADLNISGLSIYVLLVAWVAVDMMVFLYYIHTGTYTLKSLQQIVWDTRANWRLLGSELGVDHETLNVRLPYTYIQCKVIPVAIL